MRFIPLLAPDSRALLDFRVSVRATDCPHCGVGGALIAHGFLRGLAATGHEPTTRAQRFFLQPAFENRLRTSVGSDYTD